MARTVLLSAAAAACLLAAGPALADEAPRSAPPEALEMSDPLERFNRTMFKVDKKITGWLGGRSFSPPNILPGGVRRGVYNFFSNLGEPVSAANQLLQGKPERAGLAMGRFGANSTVGILGTRDVATGMGMERYKEDFGQTLATYGVPGGPYIYLPLFGPGNVRDRVAGRVDGLANPLGVVDAGMVGGMAIDGVQSLSQPQAQLSVREEAALAAQAGETDDEYARVRDLYYARRAAEIEDVGGADRVPEPYWPDEESDVQYARAQPPAPPREARPYRPDPRYARAAPPPPSRYARPAPQRRRYAEAPRFASSPPAYGYGPPPPPRRAYAPPRAYGYAYAPPPPPPPGYRDRAAERAAAQAAADAAYWNRAYVGWDQ
jgi:phospholipid-binding lipoprotein MlaA